MSFLSSTLNIFLFPGVFSKATTRKNFEIWLCLKVQKFSRKYIVQLFQCKAVVSSVYSKNLTLYEIRLKQKIKKQPFLDVHKIGLFQNFAKFTGKHLYRSFYLIICRPPACNLMKKGPQCRCFPIIFARFLKHAFL